MRGGGGEGFTIKRAGSAVQNGMAKWAKHVQGILASSDVP